MRKEYDFGKGIRGKYTECSMKIREVIKMIEADGWFLVATKGSHRQYKHPQKSGRVTVAGKFSHDLAQGTLNSILKQAQLKKEG